MAWLLNLWKMQSWLGSCDPNWGPHVCSRDNWTVVLGQTPHLHVDPTQGSPLNPTSPDGSSQSVPQGLASHRTDRLVCYLCSRRPPTRPFPLPQSLGFAWLELPHFSFLSSFFCRVFPELKSMFTWDSIETQERQIHTTWGIKQNFLQDDREQLLFYRTTILIPITWEHHAQKQVIQLLTEPLQIPSIHIFAHFFKFLLIYGISHWPREWINFFQLWFMYLMGKYVCFCGKKYCKLPGVLFLVLPGNPFTLP